MPIRPPKEKTDRFLEIRDPKKAVGLWSHHAEFCSTLHRALDAGLDTEFVKEGADGCR